MRPLIVKLAFYLPHEAKRGKGLASAVAHLRYIGNPDKDELLVADAAIHARYMTHRPGAAGYFGPDPRTLPDVQAVMGELRAHDGPIWRLIVSVHEDDALVMGGALCRREGWEAPTRAAMAQVRRALGLKNVEWIAAVHRKQSTEPNPHLHLLLWEPSARRQQGRLTKGELHATRGAWTAELYEPVRSRLGSVKSEARSAALRALRRALADGVLRDDDDARWLAERLEALHELIGEHGKAALAYIGPDARALAADVVAGLFERVPEMQAAFAEYVAAAGEFASHHSTDPGRRRDAERRAATDLSRRLAQQVVREARRAGQRSESIRPPGARARPLRLLHDEERTLVRASDARSSGARIAEVLASILSASERSGLARRPELAALLAAHRWRQVTEAHEVGL
jgi:hypothetical protein